MCLTRCGPADTGLTTAVATELNIDELIVVVKNAI